MNDVDKKEVFAHLIDRLEPLAGLTPEERDLAVQRGEILSFEAGQSIFRQGEWDDFEYFVLQGEVETFAGGERIKWIAAHHKEATQPIAPSQPRAVTAKAGTPVVILRLPSMIEDDLLDVPGAQPESWTDAL
nr:cyclic nucleotide-binding domain-containing protein [Gammaproteobacteria bacterium]